MAFLYTVYTFPEDADSDHRGESDEDVNRVRGERKSAVVPYQRALIAALVVWLFGATISALGMFCNPSNANLRWLVCAFASGALSATATNILIPRALFFLIEAGNELNVVSISFGTLFLIGFMTPSLAEMLTVLAPKFNCLGYTSGRRIIPDSTETTFPDTTKSDAPQDWLDNLSMVAEPKISEVKTKMRLDDVIDGKQMMKPMLTSGEGKAFSPEQTLAFLGAGVWFRRFLDGMYIALTFKSCISPYYWSFVGPTMIYNASTDLLNTMVLMSTGMLSPFACWARTFASGSAILLGATTSTFHTPSASKTGLLYSYLTGVYFWIATATWFGCTPWTQITRAGEHDVTMLQLAMSFAIAFLLVSSNHFIPIECVA